MPGYGVAGPEEGRGLLPWSWAQERLKSPERYWVVSVWEDGRPHAMPVWGVWWEEAVWFSTGTRSRKARNLRADPRCVVHTDGEDPVVVEGVAEVVTDAAVLEPVLSAYADKYGMRPPDPAENPIFRVRPHTAFGLVEREFSTSPTRWTFR